MDAQDAREGAAVPDPTTTPPDAIHAATDATPAPEGTHPFGRRKGERPEWHRALILYAMMDPKKRSKRAVARTLNRSDQTIRRWFARQDWKARIKEAGPSGQRWAMQLYWRTFLPRFGRVELSTLVNRISIPIDPEDPNAVYHPSEGDMVKAGARATGKKANGPKAPDPELAIITKGEVMIDGALSRLAQRLVDPEGKIRIEPKDIPDLIRARRYLVRERRRIESGDEAASESIEVVESFRVRKARASGGDVMGALALDAEDLALVTRSIVDQRTHDATVQTELEERLEEELASADDPETEAA